MTATPGAGEARPQKFHGNKKVLLLVIDALSARIFVPALRDGRLPNFQALAERGQLDPACSAIFPSITHAALSSIATGVYPQVHGIPGGYWFNVEQGEVVHYMGDLWIALNQGVRQFFADLVVRLNAEQIQAETVFQYVERAGNQACSIHHLIYKGDVLHRVDVSWLAKLIDRVLPSKSGIADVSGPTLLYLGDFIATAIEQADQTMPAIAGLSKYLGMEDRYALERLLALARADALPALTVAYFLENDDRSHLQGPANAFPVLEALDQGLGELFEVCGGVERLLEQFCVIVTGDHAQVDISGDEETASIQVDKLLSAFRLPAPGAVWNDGEELLVCPNMRALQIYFKHPEAEMIEMVAGRLLADERVDLVMWRAALTDPTQTGYIISTRDRGRLHAWPVNGASPGQPPSNQATDFWGCTWRWQGDLSAIDAHVEDGVLVYGDYPNALERIAGALECPTGGRLWASAMPGAEFSLGNTAIHRGGGSHGSLHHSDSVVPLLMAGAPDDVQLPARTRSVDVTPLVLRILKVDGGPPLGESRVLRPC
ncbi:MAG TPA: alkaline phosphatase family protein [Caldilineaceae bacterium]|nr:alkaline phosphatase family protein [Caldilineaceae bacterium]